jgi:hypothetical protein
MNQVLLVSQFYNVSIEAHRFSNLLSVIPGLPCLTPLSTVFQKRNPGVLQKVMKNKDEKLKSCSYCLSVKWETGINFCHLPHSKNSDINHNLVLSLLTEWIKKLRATQVIQENILLLSYLSKINSTQMIALIEIK